MDGPTATKAIRAMGGKFATLPILGVTGNMMEDDVQCFLESGATAVLGKPLDFDKFDRLLRSIHGVPMGDSR
jgi:two-component system, sensor histidine kinase